MAAMADLADSNGRHSAQPWGFLGLTLTNKMWDAKQEDRPQGRVSEAAL